MKLKIWEMSLITAFVITLLTGAVLSNGQQELADKLIRLHVVANSDADYDQALKLDVRDRVAEELAKLLEGVTKRKEAERLINENIGTLTAAATEEIGAQGHGYSVHASLTVEHFPTREYDTFALPAGDYTSLRIVIGEGIGHNWWCVIFPPICMETAVDNGTPVMNLTENEISLITEETSGYIVKFKAMEWLGSLKNTIVSLFN